MNEIIISNINPQDIIIEGGGSTIGLTAVYVNGVDVTVGSVAYVIVPTKLSELENNVGFITQETDPTVPYYVKEITMSDINSWNSKQDALVSGVNIKTINNNSILGSGNLNVDTSYSAGTGIEITEENVINNTITSYDDLTDLPTIPTKTSELTNDSNFVTSSELNQVAFTGDYDDLTGTPTIPTLTSELENDSGFITNRVDDLLNYYDKNFLFNYFPKVSGSGINLSLNNTYPSNLNIKLSPSIMTQETTTGKNILPFNLTTIKSNNTLGTWNGNVYSYNGLDFTFNDDGSFKINGTSTGNSYVNLYLDTSTSLVTTGTYTFSKGINNGNIILCIYENISGWQNIKYAITDYTTYTPSGNQTGQMFRILIENAKTISNVMVYPMLESGSTATEWEQYTGGIPAPNPQFPFPVHNVSGSNTIRVVGKNLLSINNFTPTGASDILTNYPIFIKAGSCSVSFTTTTTRTREMTIRFYYEDGTSYAIGINSNETSKSFTLSKNVISISWYVREAMNLSNVQIEQSNTPTTYEPYNGNSYSVNLGLLEYNKIGDYSDRIFKNVEGDPDFDDFDLEVGLWYLKKNIRKVVLNGSENWYITPTNTTGKNRYYTQIVSNNILKPSSASSLPELICNKYIRKTANQTYTLIQGMSIDSYGNILIYDENRYNLTADEFKIWVSSNNIIIYYVLESPIYTQITGTLEDELEAIYNNSLSKSGQTNISQINADLPFIIDAITLKDISNL